MAHYRDVVVSVLVSLLLLAYIAMAEPQLYPSLSESSVLLPRKTIHTQAQYKLQAFNGCFSWRSLDPSVASVMPIQDGVQEVESKCANQAIIWPESMSLERRSTWIEAKDVRSNIALRCEVFVDNIKNFSILTTTKKFYRSDVELLKIQALDNEGNLFSTVEGLQFEWGVSSSKSTTGTVLRILPFKGSTVEVNSIVVAMEERGLQTGAILLQGIQPGKANVFVKLIDPVLEGVTSASVQIVVVEPIMIFPTTMGASFTLPLYVVPRAKVLYSLSVRSSSPSEPSPIIPMPNTKYIWNSDNEKVATVNANGLVIAHSSGIVHVSVRHADVPESEAHATVHVVEPSELRISLHRNATVTSPVSLLSHTGTDDKKTKWVIQNDIYSLDLLLYDASGHAILHTEGLKFDLAVDNRHIQLLSSSKDNNHHEILPTSLGESRVVASFLSSEWLVPKVEITVRGSKKITTRPEGNMVLPRDPQPVPMPGYEIKAEGGSGDYMWKSSNGSIAMVSSTGVVTPIMAGSVSVEVSDMKNPSNIALVKASIVPINKIELHSVRKDCQVGHALSVKVLATTVDGQPFSNCSFLPFQWTVTPPSVFSVQQDVAQVETGGCASISLLAVGEGEALVTLTYYKLRTELKLFAYAPLQLRTSPLLVIAVGADAPIMFDGGPYPHEYAPSSYFLGVVPSHPEKVKITKVEHRSSMHHYTLTCVQLGDLEVTVAIMNDLPSPLVEIVKVHCVLPSRLFVAYAANERRLLDRDLQVCREMSNPPVESVDNLSTKTYITRNNQDIMLNVSLRDEMGRNIQYFNSLVIEWQSDNKEVVFKPKGAEQTMLHIGDIVGLVSVTASVTGFQPGAVEIILPMLPLKSLIQRFTLNVAPSVSLLPSQALVYNHPQNTIRLTRQWGSLVSYTTNDTETVELVPTPDLSAVDVVPHKPGTVLVEVQDRCISDSQGQALVQVGDVGWINLLQPQRLSGQAFLQIEEELVLHVQVGAGPEDQNPYPAQQYRFIPIHFHVDNPDAISIRPMPFQPDRYTIRALSNGVARIIFSSKTSSGRVVSSSALSVTVYPAVALKPAALVLVPGGKFSVGIVGGPPLQPQFSFSVDNTTVCSVDSYGQVVALSPGTATLTAVVSSTAAATTSSASIPIAVNPLEGIRIYAKTDRLMVGNEMTLRVVGPDGETPFTMGTLNISFVWHSRDSNVAAITPIYAEAGARLEDEMSFSVRVKALVPGSTIITVSVLHSKWTAIQVLTVVDGLALTTPAEVLLPPQGSHRIGTNKQDCNCLSYTILSTTPPDAVSLSTDGVITAGLKPGQAVVQVTDNTILSLVVQIRVRPIHQIQLLPAVSSFHEVPIGGEMKVKVVVRDEVGQVFTAIEGLRLDYQLDQPEVIAIRAKEQQTEGETDTGILTEDKEGTFITIHALKEGTAILRAFTLTQPMLDDYLRISVGQAILPSMPVVHVGGVISFGTTLAPHPQVILRNLWSSNNEQVLRINTTSGEGQALTKGYTRVIYNGTVRTYTDVQVETVGGMEVDVGVGFVTNVGEGRQYYLRLRYSDSAGRSLPSRQNRIDNKIIVSCSLPPSSLWMTAKFVRNDDGDYCILSSLPSSSTSLPARMPDTLTLIVTVRDVHATYEYQHKETIPFVPAFLVKGPTELHLSPSRQWATVEVWSSSPIFATTTDAALLSVRLQSSDSLTGRHSYEIRALSTSTPFSHVGVELLNPLTQQSLVLEVSFTLDTQLVTTDKSQPRLVVRMDKSIETAWLQPLGWIIGSAILASLVLLVLLRLLKQPSHKPAPVLQPSPSPHRVFIHSASSPLQPPTISRRNNQPRSPVFVSPYSPKRMESN